MNIMKSLLFIICDRRDKNDRSYFIFLYLSYIFCKNKPFRLLKNRRKRQTEYDERYIEFVDHGVIFPIRIKEIDFIEYAQRKLYVYTRGKKYTKT